MNEICYQSYPWKFPGISYFSDLRRSRCARKIPKPVLKTTLINKGTTFGKYFVEVIFCAFGRLIKDYHRNLTSWVKTKHGVVEKIVLSSAIGSNWYVY
jgi:hypothetical protein